MNSNLIPYLFWAPIFFSFSSLSFNVFCQQTISIGDTGVTLATLNDTIPSTNFTCGANRFQEFIPQLFNSSQCKNLKDAMNVCCIAHDSCYNTQVGKEPCDNTFCNCLSVVTEKNLCAVDASGLCTAVRLFGDHIYETLGQGVSPSIN